MATATQVTLIICLTTIALAIIGRDKNKGDK